MTSNFCLYYAGKGGVGKTTCAAARAVAEAAAGSAVLVVSTDPAHSLGDALGVRLSARPRRVGRSLDAMELDAPRAFARWLKEHRRPLGEIIEHGTWLDREDVDALLELSIPGVDELMGILEIDRLASQKGGESRTRKGRGEKNRSYDLIVVDTAPTGHTLRLLAAPETVAAVADALESLQREHRLIRDQLARVGRPEAADRLIALLAGQAHDAAARLRDPARTGFVWVTLPEELALAETEDGLAALEKAGMTVGEILVNRLLPAGGLCSLCDARRAAERKVLAAIRRRAGRRRRLTVVAAALKEPRGVAALASLRRERVDASQLKPERPINHRPLAISHEPSAIDRYLAQASLLFFGGKGGVGKSTVAASVALRLAKDDEARRVLLLSTDPAHSLGDVFRAAVGDTARTVAGAPPNLTVRELDAARALAVRRADLEAALAEVAAAAGVGGSNLVASELMSLAPPGIDELFGILSVVQARADYDVIVVDTAPTGHALRLLEMPETAREWMQVLLRVLLKYRALVRPGRLAAELVELSKAIRELIALLQDKEATRFVVVTRAAELPRRETARLLGRLRRLHVSTPAIVVNALTFQPGSCARCRAVAAAERRELGALRRLCRRGCAMIRTPLAAPPPRGAAALASWSRTWIRE